MPELPGPPAGYDDEQRRIWFEGAATVAKLQSYQWSIIADQYRQAAEDEQAPDADDVDGAVAVDTDRPQPPDEDETNDECPECGGTLVAGFGGLRCGTCGYEPEDTDT